MILRTLRPALSLLLVMTVLLGLAYPLLITGVAKLGFSASANGSLVWRDGQLLGSSLIGQSFTDPRYFWGRPSATSPAAYDPTASGGSNLGPLNPALITQVKGYAAALRAADPDNTAAIPVDLVSASASGLDPDLSPAGIRYQAARVARARGMDPARLEQLISAREKPRTLGFLGERRINVLELNLALDR